MQSDPTETPSEWATSSSADRDWLTPTVIMQLPTRLLNELQQALAARRSAGERSAAALNERSWSVSSHATWRHHQATQAQTKSHRNENFHDGRLRLHWQRATRAPGRLQVGNEVTVVSPINTPTAAKGCRSGL